MDEQVQQIGDDLDRFVDRVRAEYDVSYAVMVGILHMKAHLLCEEAEREHGGG